MAGLDHSVFEWGYVTHEGIDPVALGWSQNKVLAFSKCIFPGNGCTGKVS